MVVGGARREREEEIGVERFLYIELNEIGASKIINLGA